MSDEWEKATRSLRLIPLPLMTATNPTNAAMYFAHGDSNAFDSWGEAAFPNSRSSRTKKAQTLPTDVCITNLLLVPFTV
jgi:hypothetical protein